MSELFKGQKGYIHSGQGALFGHAEVVGFGLQDYHVKEIARDKANALIVKNHYSKKFYSASYIHLGVFAHGEIKGVLQFGYAMNPSSQNGVVEGTAQDEYLELNRMWLDDTLPRNGESLAISFAIKYIKRVYPKIKWIQSFADERCNMFGIVYQAANFIYCGEHLSTFWFLDNEIYHNSLMSRDPKLSKSAAYIQANKERATSKELRQFRYLYFINKGCQKNLKLKVYPYPKYYEQRRGITPLALDGGDSAASQALSQPDFLSTLQGESTPAHRK